MFTGIKNEMNHPVVHRILSHVAMDNTPEGIAEIIRIYQSDPDSSFYAWIEKGKTLGICGFAIYTDKARIRIISVAEDARGRGVGGAMVEALQKIYGKDIEADTNDDAVGFYRKRGFVTHEYIHETRGKRYTCILPLQRTVTQ